jgi:hypothetical protein
MDIEELTKSQLILLTVLVNFVTSIATGILTVSLLDQAPPIVTQTVNRVVEHTVETVTQVAPATVIQAPKPSVEDLITAAFAADQARIVTLYALETGTSTESFAIGTYLPKSRSVATVASETFPAEILVKFTNGEMLPASRAHTDTTLSIYSFSDDAKLPSAVAPTLVAAKDLKVGQTVLAVDANGAGVTGIVSKVTEKGIQTSLPETSPGTAAVDLSGNLVGIMSKGTENLFVSADHIRTLLASPVGTTTPAT